jgi:hypothetical protein
MAPTDRSGSPSKGNASVHYPPIPATTHSTADQPDDEVLTLKAQVISLQQVQVEQAVKAQQTQASLSNIEKLLFQMNERDQSRGRSRSRSIHASRDMPLPTTEPTENRVRTHDSPASNASQSHNYSKKLPDPVPLSNGADPAFESWRIQIKGKLRANADHFSTEEDKMFYVFGRTTGDAQKHLLSRFDEDSPVRFVTVTDMIQHLASVYVNPNKVRDARYSYGKLVMRTSQSFAEFQTTFLHLAGEGQVPADSLRLDLYDKLTTPLQERLAVMLEDLDTYAKLAARCLSLDTELKRITARIDRQKQFKVDKPNTEPTLGSTAAPSLLLPNRNPTTSSTPTPEARRLYTPALTVTKPATCFNCQQTGHLSKDCTEPRRKTDLKDIEDEEGVESGKDDA